MANDKNERNKRNEKMFEAVIRGETLKAAADAGGVTTERARQVIAKMRRMMMHPKRLGKDIVPDHNYLLTSELRRCAYFWLAQLDKWKTEHGSNHGVQRGCAASWRSLRCNAGLGSGG